MTNWAEQIEMTHRFTGHTVYTIRWRDMDLVVGPDKKLIPLVTWKTNEIEYNPQYRKFYFEIVEVGSRYREQARGFNTYMSRRDEVEIILSR